MQEIKLNDTTDEENTDIPKSQAQLDYNEGQEFLKKEETSMAANSFHNALLGFQKDNETNGIANVSDKLGDICLMKESYEQALKHWQTTYEICEKANDRISVFSIVKKRAKLYWQWKKYPEAINLHLDMLDEYSANNNPQGSVETLESLCEIYLEKEDKAKAADCLRTAAEIHKNFKHKNFYDRLMARAESIEK